MIILIILINTIKMLNSIKDTLNITRNARNIKTNRAVTDTLLNKVSFLEVEIQNNKEDTDKNMKATKQLIEFNRQTNKVRLEELEVENIELKSMLLKTSKHIIQNDENQRKINNKNNKEIYNLNRIILKLSEKLDIVLENNQQVENNNEELLEQIEKVDNTVMKLYHYKRKIK